VVGSDHQLPASSPPKTTRSKGIRALIWVLLLAFFGAGFFLVMRHQDTTQKAGPGGGGGSRRGGGPGTGGPVPITTDTARRGNIGVYINAIGTVTPVYTSSISSQVTGIVTDVHYREGQLVRKGVPLLEIDSRPYLATLTQAQGILQRDQGILAQAQMDLDRYRAAWARNAIQRQQLDDQEKLVDQVQGTVKNDQGVVQADEIQVQFCHIVSPINGRIGLRLVDPGNVVQANSGTVLSVVTQLQPITVVFTVAEDSLSQIQQRLRQGAKLPVEAYDRTNQKMIARGTLLSLDNQVDTTTGTVKARASFTNSDSALFPNAFVNARLLVNTLNNATLIPSDAIQHNGQEAFVYAIENNHAHLRPITVGVTEGQTAQVQGIDPGDVLATSGFDKLQDNAQITVATRQRGNGPAGNRRAAGNQGSTGDETPSGNAPQGMGKSHGNGPNGSGGNATDNGNAPGGNNTGQTGNGGTSSNGGNASSGGSAPR
jgi:multidrug efflux system membrane fusion protein